MFEQTKMESATGVVEDGTWKRRSNEKKPALKGESVRGLAVGFGQKKKMSDLDIYGLRILIVDDEPTNVDLIRQILEVEGYTNIVSTTDPRTVLALQEANGFDLILLDLRMPNMGGIQVLEAIEEDIRNEFLPVLVLSEEGDDASRMEAYRAGAKDFLAKPFKRWEVLFRIRNLLEVRALFNQRRRQTERLKQQVYRRTQELTQAKRVETVLGTGVLGFGIETLEGKSIRANPRLCELIGYEEDEVLAKHFSEYTFPEDAAHDLALFQEVASGMRDSYQIEKRYIHRNGSIVWGRLTRFRLKGEGEQRDSVVGIVEDITELKRAESELSCSQARFQAVVDAAPALMTMKDMDGRFVWCNRLLLDFFGLELDDVLGKTEFELLPRDVAERIAEQEAQVCREGVPLDFELDFVSKQGETHTLLLNRFPVRGIDGTLAWTGVVGTDITERKRMENALRDREERLAEAQEIAHLGNWSMEPNSDVVTCSEQVFRIFGREPESGPVSHRSFMDSIHPEDRPYAEEVLGRLATTGEPFDFEHRVVLSEGGERVVRVRGGKVCDEHGALLRLVGTVQDVDEDRRRADRLRMLSYIVEQNSAVVVVTDTHGIIEYANPKFTEVTGYAVEDALGKTPSIMKSGETPREVYQDMWKALLAGKEWSGELLNTRKDGTYFWEFARIYPLRDDRGRVAHFVAIKEDITDRKRIEAELIHQRHYDPQTGLPNRILTFDRISERVERVKKAKGYFGVMMVNLDGFSRINAEFGMEVGDAVLAESAKRIQRACESDLVSLGRIGGDRFCVGVEGFQSTAMLELLARRILELLREPMRIGEDDYRLTGTVGISVYPHDGASADSLLRNAESAVRVAQAHGPNSYRFFTASKSRGRSLRMETLLQDALDRNELFLEYQPIVSAGGDPAFRFLGAEALLRWCNPELGAVSPGEFVPLFEDNELAHGIGNWIIEEAVSRMAELRKATGGEYFVSVNVSPRQLRRAEFVESVAEILSRTGLPPGALKLEITERLFVEKRPEVMAVLAALDDLGTIVTLDDFGTGFSALRSLIDLPVRTLKIDKSFVDSLGSDRRTSAMIGSISALCQRLSIQTVAEGVESLGQASELRRFGVDCLQGFHFSRPVSWEALEFSIADEQAVEIKA